MYIHNMHIHMHSILYVYYRRVCTHSLGNKNVKIFNNTDCNGYSQTYVVFHVYGSISVPTYMQ